MSLPPTFNEKRKLKYVSEETECRSEDNYDYQYKFNRSETNEYKTIAEILENIRDTSPVNNKIKKPSNILPPSERKFKQAIQSSSSHPHSVNPTKYFTERDTVIRR